MPDLVLVEVAGRRLAVPAARVREVSAVSTVTPIPTAPPPVVGLTQLRGQIIAVLDLAPEEVSKDLLTSHERMPRPQDPLVVVELGPARAALWVDRVLGVQADDSAEVIDIGALFDQVRQRLAVRP
jgi:purine-binding chemotaxis protein CheW